MAIGGSFVGVQEREIAAKSLQSQPHHCWKHRSQPKKKKSFSTSVREERKKKYKREKRIPISTQKREERREKRKKKDGLVNMSMWEKREGKKKEGAERRENKKLLFDFTTCYSTVACCKKNLIFGVWCAKC